MNSIDSMREEFVAEAATTRRVLDRIPADKLGWKPHARSMTLGQLAFHIATVPGGIARITKPESFDVSKNNFDPPQPASLEQVRAAFEESVSDAEKPWRSPPRAMPRRIGTCCLARKRSCACRERAPGGR